MSKTQTRDYSSVPLAIMMFGVILAVGFGTYHLHPLEMQNLFGRVSLSSIKRPVGDKSGSAVLQAVYMEKVVKYADWKYGLNTSYDTPSSAAFLTFVQRIESSPALARAFEFAKQNDIRVYVDKKSVVGNGYVSVSRTMSDAEMIAFLCGVSGCGE